MAALNSCRLCFSANTELLNVFSVIGIEQKISEIISEHFKCEIAESDALPNFICQVCWSTTEAFHDLYQKSKTVQENFLNPIIKIECDSTDAWQENERDLCDELDVSVIKVEPIPVEFGDALDPQADFDVSDETLIDHGTDKQRRSISTIPEELKEDSEDDVPLQKIRKIKSKQRSVEFKKLFAENKHRFDLSCDCCTKVFDTLDEARNHYASEHNNPKGYIKCCNVKLTYRCDIVRHMYRHLEPNKFKCKECGKNYNAKHVLKAHMRQHVEHVEKKCLICDICKKTFTSKVGLKRHLLWHSEGSAKTGNEQHNRFIAENFDMNCDHCDAVFATFHDARRHYREQHNEKKGYIKCCNIKLRELWIVVDHINSHLNPSNFKCDLCNKNFSSGMRLNQHKGRHRRAMERPFICDLCGKSFRDKETILRHLFTRHVDSEPKYECEICHKRFQLPNLLKNHCYSVHREKKAIVTCEICGKSFSVKANFDKHMLSHTDKSERLAQLKQCEHCGEWLMTKSGIYYHEQIHTSGVQKCTQCEMELPHKIALLAHIRKYHRERNHKCSYCDKSFPVSSELKKHEEGHTRHNVYPCQFCKKIFTLRTSRLTHQKRSHKLELKELREMRKLTKHSIPTVI